MSNEANLQVFYSEGVRWATHNLDTLRPLQADRAELERHARATFNWEGFIETWFQSFSMRLWHLAQSHLDIVEEKFVAGVCDTICGK